MACGRCPGSGNPPTSSGCPGGNCFRALNYTLPCADSAPPGGSFSKDLTLVNSSIKGCSNGDGDCDVTYQLLSAAAGFTGVTISEAGLLEGSFTDEAVPNTTPIIRYKIFCNCNTLSATAKVYVCVQDLCVNENCEEGFECDPVTGDCVASVNIGTE